MADGNLHQKHIAEMPVLPGVTWSTDSWHRVCMARVEITEHYAVELHCGALTSAHSALWNEWVEAVRKLSEIAHRAPAGPVCGNCATEVPPGCSGLFKDDGGACALNRTHGVTVDRPQPPTPTDADDGEPSHD